MRLDHYLCTHHYTQSRNQAKALILAQKVSVNGRIVTKPALILDSSREYRIEILQEKLYVSRAAQKLKAFLEAHPIAVAGKRCLDIGSSTGGFVQVLLEMGASEVTGVDVGTDQLHETLRNDPRVVSVEQTDVRDFESDTPYELVTCDVSFTGVTHILPSIDRLAARDIVLLFKPQFEVGKDVKRTKKGVVKDQKAIEAAMRRFEAEVAAIGWKTVVHEPSRVKGKEGNAEIFYHFTK